MKNKVIPKINRYPVRISLTAVNYVKLYSCNNCEGNLNRAYNYCPYCGFEIDWDKSEVDHEKVSRDEAKI